MLDKLRLILYLILIFIGLIALLYIAPIFLIVSIIILWMGIKDLEKRENKKDYDNPLAELNKRIFKSANRFVVNVVYILKDCKCTYFPEYSGKQSYCIFSIISHYHELIA